MPFRSFPICFQHETSDCGAACLSMISRYYGCESDFSRINRICIKNKRGISLLALSKAAKRLGFNSMAVKTSLEKFMDHVDLPAIVYWQRKHFIVVYSITRWKVYTADPAIGYINYTWNEFEKGFIDNDSGSGIVLILNPGDHTRQNKNTGNTSNSLEFLKAHLKVFKRKIPFFFTCMIILCGIQYSLPYITRNIVDLGIRNSDYHLLILFLISQLLLHLFQTSFMYIQNYLLMKLGFKIKISMLSGFLIKIFKLPMQYFDRKMDGDLMQRIQDHTRLQHFFSHTSGSMAMALLNFIVFSFIMVSFSRIIFLIFFGMSAVFVLYTLVFMKQRMILDYKNFSNLSRNHDQLMEMIQGMEEIKLNNAQTQKIKLWQSLQAEIETLSVKGFRLSALQEGGANAINLFKNAITTFWAAYQVIEGNITLGELLAIQFITAQLNIPLALFVNFLQQFQDTRLGLERMMEVQKAKEETISIEMSAPSPSGQSIFLRDVSFDYGEPGSAGVLNNLNAEIEAGKVTAVVGESGSGKSTLMKLILRVYEPTHGYIFFGTTKLTRIPHDRLREVCGIVLQDGRLFSDSIAANIAFGHPIVNLNNVHAAAETACIRNYIESLPLGYDTIIGRNGKGISRGQMQRIMIARAVYRNPAYLFLDEATSALDARTEHYLMRNLQDYFKSRTVLVIAHRMSTVRNADKILVMERGHIVEQGVHEELVSQSGIYFNLIRNQLDLEYVYS